MTILSSIVSHIAVFPFMSKGHTIPLLYLVKLIHNHRPQAMFTIFTTPANEPFISTCLSSIPPNLINIISFSFPATREVPIGVESTDQLPSMSLLYPFLYATERLQTDFEAALESLQNSHHPVNFLISDGFLHWTQVSTAKFNIPRFAFYGMSNYAFVVCSLVSGTRLFSTLESEDELIQVPDFPWISITRNDMDSPWNEREPTGPEVEYVMKCGIATSMSYGLLVNSFYELESHFVDYWNKKFQPKAWCVGPVCLAEKPKLGRLDKPGWIEWLDMKKAQGKHVLYVAFGTQAEISDEQLKEITVALEKSEVDFLWTLRIKPNQEEVIDGFDQRVKDKGLIVRGWVEQREILEHEVVEGFLSHCGWNSVTESICAGVPILAWPMMAEQHLNARMVVEEIKVGFRVETCNGSVRGLIKWEGLSKAMREVMAGETVKVKLLKENVKMLRNAAEKAMNEGGSSSHSLKLLLELKV